MVKKLIVLILITSMIAVSACKKKIVPDDNEQGPNDISLFIWEAMYDNYLWYDNVGNLNGDMRQDMNSFYQFLNGYGTDYEALFDDLLYRIGEVDKWSWIIDDWEEQEQSFAGISTSMGYDFRLVQFYGSDEVFGYVRYVLPGSPADIAGVKRGDVFLSVDDQQLTLSNYYFLLFEQTSYDLSLAEFIGNTVTPTGVTVSMTSVLIQENPVFKAEILDIGDGQKTAYMVYNSFVTDFDLQLNDAFGYFESEGATRFILDLRYNGGGYISSAIHLASMIYSTDDTKVFAKYNYNDKIQNYYVGKYGDDYLNVYLTGLLDTTTIFHDTPPPLPPINNLGLDEIFIIGTGSTASASEMIINGLDPYMNVVQVGDTTRGKYVGSWTIKDYYTYGGSVPNPDHKWALQPITLKISNSEGVSDFVGGLLPDVAIEEDIRNMLPLGDPDEALLAATIDYIIGGKKASMRPDYEPLEYRVIADSRELNPLSNEMYIRYPNFVREEDFRFYQEK